MSLKKNTIWSFFGSAGPMLLGLITIPYLIENIHVEAFGILTLVWALIGYFSIFDFGIGRALTHQVSRSISQSIEHELPSIIKTGLLFMLATGFLGGLILALLSSKLGSEWLNVSKNLEIDTIRCLLIASIGIPLATITSGLKGILEGYEDFKSASLLRLILGIANFVFPALSVFFLNNSLEYMVLSLVIARLIVMIGHLIVINKRISIYSLMVASLADKIKLKKLLSFGAWMTLSNIISPLMVNADRFLISHILGASVVAYYTIPFDFVIRLLIIPASLTSVLFPRFSNLLNINTKETLKIYKKSFFIIFKVMLLVSILMISFSYLGLKIWINEDVASKSYFLLIILMVGVFFNSLAQVPFALIQADGKVKLTSLLHVVEFFIYIGMLVLLANYFGLVGVAIAFLLRTIIDFLFLSKIAKSIFSHIITLKR